ncbi:hydroxymethylglutaryl-CoA lyase [Pseudonocardia ailaonensis]|uniref:Hydroxymethylglutaryl-CoA lyase n=1 Tax=Pseudonocardia ailaonensis TaxID=367279 RepID=A0ABN2MZX9_9PSEU
MSGVRVCEAWLRDGIQGWPTVLDTADKIRMLEAVAAAGVPEIDVTSFVPAHVVPQFGDAEEVLAAVPEQVLVRVLTVNAKGARRVAAAHATGRRIDRCGFPISASEPHNLANLRRDHAAHKVAVAEMVDVLGEAGIAPLLGVATAYGCPIQGRVERAAVLDLVGWGHALGIRSIMFGDTTGMADPRTVHDLFTEAVRTFPDVEFVAHFHDNRGCGIANTLAAIDAGAATVDASLGGVGGEPAAVEQGFVGESGNVTTEDLAAVLDRMGVRTGIDLTALLRAGALAEELLGRPLLSRVLRAGPVPA